MTHLLYTSDREVSSESIVLQVRQNGVYGVDTHQQYACIVCGYTPCQVDRKKPPPPGGVSFYYVPSSRTVCKRTPLEEPGINPSRGVLLHTVLDGGT